MTYLCTAATSGAAIAWRHTPIDMPLRYTAFQRLTMNLLIASIAVVLLVSSQTTLAQGGDGAGRVTISSFNHLTTRQQAKQMLTGWRFVADSDTLLRAVPGATITAAQREIGKDLTGNGQVYEDIGITFAMGRAVRMEVKSPQLRADRAPTIKSWLEASQSYSGSSIPRVGQEVIVDYMRQAERGTTVEVFRATDNSTPSRTVIGQLRKSDADFCITIIIDLVTANVVGR
jgi:hypothetical protein